MPCQSHHAPGGAAPGDSRLHCQSDHALGGAAPRVDSMHYQSYHALRSAAGGGIKLHCESYHAMRVAVAGNINPHSQSYHAMRGAVAGDIDPHSQSYHALRGAAPAAEHGSSALAARQDPPMLSTTGLTAELRQRAGVAIDNIRAGGDFVELSSILNINLTPSRVNKLAVDLGTEMVEGESDEKDDEDDDDYGDDADGDDEAFVDGFPGYGVIIFDAPVDKAHDSFSDEGVAANMVQKDKRARKEDGDEAAGPLPKKSRHT